MRTDARATIRWMTVGWAVAFVAAAVFHGRLEDAGRGWWVWTPLVAVALGLYGLRWLSRLDRRTDP